MVDKILEVEMNDLESIAEKRGVAVYVVLDEIVLDETVGKN